jgi:hypothetical protein
MISATTFTSLPPNLPHAHCLAPCSRGSLVLPAPGACSHAGQVFSSIEAWLSAPSTLQLPLHQIEHQQEQRGRQLQRLLLQTHVQQRGNGDVGSALCVTADSTTSLYSHRRLQRRTLKTIFGPIDIDRMGYGRNGADSIHPLDEAMQLPARSFSYELQKRMAKAAVQGPFRESTERIQEITGLTVPIRSLEQILQEAAQDFDAFYAQRLPHPSQPAASILVVAVDCKGIPIVKTDHNKRLVRRTKGQKANRKKMATVATVFTRQPWIRTPLQVVESLFRIVNSTSVKTPTGQPPPPRPENKRVWASLLKGKAAVIDEVVQEVRRRDPAIGKTHVALTDGERALQILVGKKMKVTLILDLLHVLEKVWKAAHVFHPEGSPEAELYARLMAHRILEGNADQVVKGLRQTVTKRKLFGGKRKTLLGVADYFHRNRDRMHYDKYLSVGLPIASGPVEGACKNLIKDRMERSGMRWTELMAEAIVKLRALYLSDDFDAYWDFHITQDQQRLHPPGRWTVVVK